MTLPRAVSACLGLLAMLSLCRCAPPAIDCTLRPVARLPLQVQDHLLVVPVGLDGHWVSLVVDTGAERSTLSRAVVERLHLPPDTRFTTRSLGVGGATASNDVKIDRLVLGGVRFPVPRMVVGAFDLHTGRGLEADGLLGADILLAFDLDIDVPGKTLTLYHSRLCPDARPPWSEPATEIPGVRAQKDRLLLPIDLDGTSGMGFLDTGAQRNVVGVDMAHRMGLTDAAMVDDPPVRQHGIGPNETIARMHQFSLLRIGPIAEENPRITVMPTDAGFGDALIGEEFLHGRRVWISFRNRTVFVSAQPDGD
ncbi:MAG TPA: aspartyl protease family protein [Rhodopila sp.]|nr:aspartyl protease family protein [Rhodopila sp.]